MAERRQHKPRNNVYTLLVAIAFLVMVLSVIFVWMQLTALTDDPNPFNVGAVSAVDLLRPVLPV